MSSYANYQALTQQIQRAKLTNLCVSCGIRPRARYRDGSLSMTCLSGPCLRKWLPHPRHVTVDLMAETEPES